MSGQRRHGNKATALFQDGTEKRYPSQLTVKSLEAAGLRNCHFKAALTGTACD